MSECQVLIVGAGPTGLVLALWLTRLGVLVRLIDTTAEPGTTSRALVVHARTLEFYRQIGIADKVISQGHEFARANLWVRGRRAAKVEIGKMGIGLSPFPFALVFPQDEHEKLLIEELASLGIHVDRNTELTAFEEQGDSVVAQLARADGPSETCRTAYLAGCDGAHSTVRHRLNIGFPGGTYSHYFYVADVAASGPVTDGALHVALDEADFLAVFPLKEPHHGRLIGTVLDAAVSEQRTISWNDVGKTVIDRLGVHVQRVNWFSTYNVHHRVADTFRRGRAFLLGDAAHIHSPVGGQGMNTGIGDAVNLAWKLAAVLQGRQPPQLLDSYEPERIAFARRLVATTDRAFTFISSTGRIARVVRVSIAPRILPLLFKLNPVRQFMFRTVSQTVIHYRHSPLSRGSAGRIQAGDRLPWVPFENEPNGYIDNFAPLAELTWQAQIFGEPPASLEKIAALCRECAVSLHQFPWQAAARTAGIEQGAIYIVRPDGYLGFTSPTAELPPLEAYFNEIGLVGRGASQNY